MSVTLARVLSTGEHLELVAIEVASLAAAFVAENTTGAAAVATKSSPTDVVTKTDLESETIIRAELRARCPGSTVVGEEYDDAVGSNDIRWIVDPIDGTVNFLYGLPVVSVSIAAMVGTEMVAGAVADVRSGSVFAAHRGGGARRNGTPMHVAAPATLADALIGTGFSYDAEVRAEQANLLTELLPACRDIRCMGSAALNLCWVGAGLLDGYFERGIKIYDYAAGALIAQEAGAEVSLPHDVGGLVWASSPAITNELGRLIEREP